MKTRYFILLLMGVLAGPVLAQVGFGIGGTIVRTTPLYETRRPLLEYVVPMELTVGMPLGRLPMYGSIGVRSGWYVDDYSIQPYSWRWSYFLRLDAYPLLWTKGCNCPSFGSETWDIRRTLYLFTAVGATHQFQLVICGNGYHRLIQLELGSGLRLLRLGKFSAAVEASLSRYFFLEDDPGYAALHDGTLRLRLLYDF